MAQIRRSFICVALLALFAAVLAKTACSNPTVSAQSYTTQDATVLTNLAFIAEFHLKCNDGSQGISLYAEIDGKTLPAARVGEGKYQVSS